MTPEEKIIYVDEQRQKRQKVGEYNDKLLESNIYGFPAWVTKLPDEKMNEWYEKNEQLLKKTIENMPDGYVLQVGGHTNARGSSNRNRAISKERARIVYKFLLAKGIKKKSLDYRGYGEKRAANTANPDADFNKKITFEIIQVDNSTFFEKLNPVDIFKPDEDKKLEGGLFQSPIDL